MHWKVLMKNHLSKDLYQIHMHIVRFLFVLNQMSRLSNQSFKYILIQINTLKQKTNAFNEKYESN